MKTITTQEINEEIALINEVRNLKNEVIVRAQNCVKRENFVIVTKDLTVTVLQQDNYSTNQLISFPAQCNSSQFDNIINEGVEHAKKQL